MKANIIAAVLGLSILLIIVAVASAPTKSAVDECDPTDASYAKAAILAKQAPVHPSQIAEKTDQIVLFQRELCRAQRGRR